MGRALPAWLGRGRRGPSSERGRSADRDPRGGARRALAIADAQADDVVDIEFLRMHTLRSLLAVPLVARAAVIGCLVFYSTTMRVFSDAEIDFARKLGATVSLALENARLYEEQQRIAQTLQENFLHELPEVPGLELGVVSRTANEPELVGGDFSDVFVVDDTHVVALIGDVAGKGVRAAGMTETVRSTVRALAVSDSFACFDPRQGQRAPSAIRPRRAARDRLSRGARSAHRTPDLRQRRPPRAPPPRTLSLPTPRGGLRTTAGLLRAPLHKRPRHARPRRLPGAVHGWCDRGPPRPRDVRRGAAH